MSYPEKSVLVLEDDKHWLDFYQSILAEDYEVTLSPSIKTALKSVYEKEFSTIIVDLKIPSSSHSEMGGFEFIQQVKKIQPQTTIIVITAYGTLDLALKAGRGGVSVFLQKPININELKEIVQRSVLSYIQRNSLLKDVANTESKYILSCILDNFKYATQSISDRKHNRGEFKIENEYDVQDILFLLLRPFFLVHQSLW